MWASLEKRTTKTNANPQVPLVVKNVSKRYFLGDTEVIALHGIDLSVSPGEFLAIAGSSGSGKTTLLNLIGCLDSPSEGTIFIEGQDTSRMSSKELAHLRAVHIGYIFQAFNLLPVLSAAENVEYPLLLLGLSREERQQWVKDALAEVELTAFAHHRPGQLSGGQRQRVAIARAMVKKPSLVLADEPTANLDKHTAVVILDLMHSISINHGTTFIFSSHDPLILSRASRIIKLSDGKVES